MFGIIAPPDVPLLKRNPHRKSRNGCVTCKERKLKCDEVKPLCRNCKTRFIGIKACNYGAGDVSHAVDATSTTGDKRSPSGKNLRLQTFRKWHSSSSGPTESVSSGLLDPFSVYPESVIDKSDVDVLMKYYLTEVVYKYYPWQPPGKINPTTTYYVPTVQNDPVSFHAILSLSCSQLNKEKKYENITRRSGQFMAESIRLVRERVEEKNCLSDETICAVTILAAIEHEKSNSAPLRMHLSGLKRMIALRGGIQKIRSSNPMIANFIFWVFTTTIYESPFPPLDPVLPPFFPGQHGLNTPFSDLSAEINSPPYLLTNLPRLSPPVHQALMSIRHVSQLIPRSDSYPTASTSLVILTRLMTILSHLMSLSQLTAPDEYSRLISECTRYALLIHIFTPWKGLSPDGTLAINHLLHQLKSFLLTLSYTPYPESQSVEREQNMVLSFWILAVGGVAAQGMPERIWFVGKLKDMCDELNVFTWEAWRQIMEKVVWHDLLCAPLHKKLWSESLDSIHREAFGS